MKVKRYEGKSEQDIMLKVRDELGPNAIILSIKKKPYRGILGWFLKPLIVVQAAFEEKTSLEKFQDEKRPIPQKSSLFAKEPKEPPPESGDRIFIKQRVKAKVPEETAAPNEFTEPAASVNDNFLRQLRLNDQQQKIASLENKLSMTEELLAKVVTQLNTAEMIAGDPKKRRFNNEILQVFYESLLEQGVASEVAEGLLGELDAVDEPEKIDITLIVKIVYNSIVEILSNSVVINTSQEADKQIVVFMGPTGVGKTTTIAKLSSMLTLTHEKKIGLITADTYRIAAVEQLKTYADILGLDIRVVYGHEDMEEQRDELCVRNNIILIDTAGRSHKNQENLTELQALLDTLPESRRYLVLSITTRYEDLLKIVKTYASITDFDLIFTKLDETETLGTILNICYLTGKKAAYVTFGQNVPDDMEVAKPDKIAKSLLGLNNGHPYLQEGGL